jgi:hypothetical protein
MKTMSSLLAIFALAAFAVAQNDAPAAGAGQQPTTEATAQSAQLQPGSLIYAELSKSIDSKKAKEGDPVVAKVTQAVLSRGKIAIPKNSRILGHLTSAKAYAKDQAQSELGIAFDRAELKGGTQIPMSGLTIQAIGGTAGLDQPPSNIANGTGGSIPSPGMAGPRSGANAGGANSPVGGSTYPSSTGATGEDVPTGTSTGPNRDSARLNATSRGVVGMSGVKLQPQPQGGLLAEEGKNLKLDSGTQLVLRTQ